MLIGLCHPGSGMGNQLFRMVNARVLALDKGLEYGIVGKENFKGKSFMDFDFGKDVPFKTHTEMPAGKLVVESDWSLFEEKTPYFNPETNFIEDNTIIDGEFQDERYFEHRMSDISDWLKVEPYEIADNWCVIGFRGGEFYTVPELGLPQEYFEEGIRRMKEINPAMLFRVETDDIELAKRFFPKLPVTHNIGENWRSMRYAKYAIVANSSFYILPRLLRQYEGGVEGFKETFPITIAPRYWDRYNIKKWERPYNYYKNFTYI